VIPSFGGYTADTTSTDIADSCTSVPAIAAVYESLITTYNVPRIDLDVEADSLTDTAGINRRNEAIAMAEAWAAAHRRRIEFSYTLPTFPSGLTSSGYAVLQNAVADHATISAVNLLTFDYYLGTQQDMVADTESAADGLFNQLQSLYPATAARELWHMIGVTEMPGIDDFGPDETFSTADAATIVRWAQRQGIGLISFWALQRGHSAPGWRSSGRPPPPCSSARPARCSRCSSLVPSPVDRTRGVRDRAHAYLLERGLEPAAVADGTGALGQRRAEPVRQRAGHALQQQRPAAPEQVRQLPRAAAGRDRHPDPVDDQVSQPARQRAEVTGEHRDQVERRAGRDVGLDPVGHQGEQRGTAHHEVILAVRAHQPDLASTDERGRVQRRQPLEQLRPGQPQRRLVQRRLALVDAEQGNQVSPALPCPEQVADPGQRVAAALQAGDELQALDVPAAVQAQAAPPFGRRQQAHRVVLADGANRQLDPPGQVVDGQRFIRLRGVFCWRGRHDWTISKNTVTVNTVTVDTGIGGQLIGVLRSTTGTPSLEYARRPEPMRGGFWAELLSFSLADPPAGWPAELVARLMPDPGSARKETVVQRAVAAAGFPTPLVRASGGPDCGLGRAFMVMDRAAGEPTLPGLDGGLTPAAVPRLLRRIPELLATSMARLHALDPNLVRGELEQVREVPVTVPGLLGALARYAAEFGRADLVSAARWLAEHTPGPAPDVICHGDLHPFNLLADGDRVTVLDWSTALLAPRAHDVGFTSLLLSEPPLRVPGWQRPLVRMFGQVLARRFVRRYQRQAAVAVGSGELRWHQAVACLRALVEVASWVHERTDGARAGHPWLVSGPAFARRLAAQTGAPVRAR